MFYKLANIANKLDKLGLYDVTDEIDNMLKIAEDPKVLLDQIDELFNSLSGDKKTHVANYVIQYIPDVAETIAESAKKLEMDAFRRELYEGLGKSQQRQLQKEKHDWIEQPTE